uniref:C2CD3 N-terminal C2 domain-containing protein n=1 Tax=Strix occidentalis caurina TaxID=311401 RepID=A0A8D0KWV8_STROC
VTSPFHLCHFNRKVLIVFNLTVLCETETKLFLIFSDMGVLVLEVMTKLDHLPIGRVQITGLSQLSPSHPISGVFTVVSPTSDKLGELQVSLVLEPLPALYDTSSSIPTTDASSDIAAAQGSSKLQFLTASQQSSQTRATIAGQESVNNSRATIPSGGKDHLLFQENSENIKDIFSASHHHLILPDERLKVNPSNQQVSFPTSTDPEAPARTNMRVLSLHNPATKDLLSALLDQGNKLRDAMVVSAMKSSPDMEIELNEVPSFIERDNFKASHNLNYFCSNYSGLFKSRLFWTLQEKLDVPGTSLINVLLVFLRLGHLYGWTR